MRAIIGLVARFVLVSYKTESVNNIWFSKVIVFKLRKLNPTNMNATMEFKSIKLDVIMVEDPKIGGFTAFFAQFPNIIAEGESEDEAVTNLNVLVSDVFAHQMNEEMASEKIKSLTTSVTVKSIEYAPV
jgi:predicted RNase H-like HicB family nuclease